MKGNKPVELFKKINNIRLKNRRMIPGVKFDENRGLNSFEVEKMMEEIRSESLDGMAHLERGIRRSKIGIKNQLGNKIEEEGSKTENSEVIIFRLC